MLGGLILRCWVIVACQSVGFLTARSGRLAAANALEPCTALGEPDVGSRGSRPRSCLPWDGSLHASSAMRSLLGGSLDDLEPVPDPGGAGAA